ncbi:hypothetical protein AB6K26_003219 [Salmonella enterica]
MSADGYRGDIAASLKAFKGMGIMPVPFKRDITDTCPNSRANRDQRLDASVKYQDYLISGMSIREQRFGQCSAQFVKLAIAHRTIRINDRYSVFI